MSAPTVSIPTELEAYRVALRSWLQQHRSELDRPAPETHEARYRDGLALSRAMWAAGWKRVGWPEHIGGLGGGPRHRATYYDELCAAGLELPDTDFSIEVMGSAVLHYAPEVAEKYLGRFISGEEGWAQGFSEPDAGSDLAALRTRAVPDGESLVVDGQKVWTSHGHFADRILTLVRTGTAESRHRGLSAVLIDTEDPAVGRHPLIFASGIDEMCETFFSGVRVGQDRMIGGFCEGWDVAMHMLQYERSMYAAQRQAWLTHRLRQMTGMFVKADANVDDATAAAIGAAWLQLQAVRSRAIVSVGRLDAGDVVGPDSSADKILLARAEQAVFEVARHVGRSAFAFDEVLEPWRSGWWYSRAASIFGGAGEVQRSIVADRVLGIPREVKRA
jgi:alkylation response protein AidB-like acyl-CoA dehydrogenase